MARKIDIFMLALPFIPLVFLLLAFTGIVPVSTVEVIGAGVLLAAAVIVFLGLGENMGSSSRGEEEVVAKEIIVPYTDWPENCYACGESISEDMDYRAQFVVHKSESVDGTKAVGLCEECAWTYSTLVDNHRLVAGAFDDRRSTEEGAEWR